MLRGADLDIKRWTEQVMNLSEGNPMKRVTLPVTFQEMSLKRSEHPSEGSRGQGSGNNQGHGSLESCRGNPPLWGRNQSQNQTDAARWKLNWRDLIESFHQEVKHRNQPGKDF